MYLLTFVQENDETHMALFESIENGRKFVSSIPGYNRIDETIEDVVFTYETIDPSELPDYLELNYKGNILPLTKYMFENGIKIELIWSELPNMDISDQGMVDGATIVDAYSIDNQSVKWYIEKRERTYERVSKILKGMGYTVERAFYGSEDGEAILIQKEGVDTRFFMHMDPFFVHDSPDNEEELIQWVKDNID